jgi:hypothetical protein
MIRTQPCAAESSIRTGSSPQFRFAARASRGTLRLTPLSALVGDFRIDPIRIKLARQRVPPFLFRVDSPRSTLKNFSCPKGTRVGPSIRQRCAALHQARTVWAGQISRFTDIHCCGAISGWRHESRRCWLRRMRHREVGSVAQPSPRSFGHWPVFRRRPD